MEIKFNKSRVLYGIILYSILIFFSILFIMEPKIFIRNVFMKDWHIILLGVISSTYFAAQLFSLFKILTKNYGIVISEDYFIDNSKYEAIGEIKWNEVSKIQRIKKTGIQIFLKNNLSERINNNLLKKFLLMMHNWDYKNSIIISSALLECDINYLEKKLLQVYKKAKLSEINTSKIDILTSSIDNINKN
jgi:hypothetical protein